MKYIACPNHPYSGPNEDGICLICGKKCEDISGWIDYTAEPNGIGPICKYCGRLIDSHPDDHHPKCKARAQ